MLQEEQRRRQQRVAEITEMIHVASLMHDDVIDSANTRRGLQALNSVFGNKVRPCHGALSVCICQYLVLALSCCPLCLGLCKKSVATVLQACTGRRARQSGCTYSCAAHTKVCVHVTS